MIIAQAFHWFDNEKTIKEIHRVLKSNCPLILLWNGYDRSIDWIQQFEEKIILPRYPIDTPRYQSGNWENIFNSKIGKELFTNIIKKETTNEINGDVTMIINRALSTSVISNQSEEVKNEVKEQVLTLLSTHSDTKDIPINTLNGYKMKYRTLIAHTFKK